MYKTCRRVLLLECARRNLRGDAVSCKKAFGKVLEQCKKANTFLHCYALNSTLKIVHEQYKATWRRSWTIW